MFKGCFDLKLKASDDGKKSIFYSATGGMYEGCGQICDILPVENPGFDGSELPVRQMPMREIPTKGTIMSKKMLKTSAEGRRCEFPHCEQRLSIYNHEIYCRVHLREMSEKDEIKHRHYA